MASLNRIMIIGNVGTDPEMRYTPSGSPVTSFRMATNRTYVTQGERREETEWFTVVAWNALAERCNQYQSKGQQCYVEGRLHSRSYQGNDGQTRFVNEIIANTVLSLDRGGAPDADGEGIGVGDSEAAATADDLPF